MGTKQAILLPGKGSAVSDSARLRMDARANWIRGAVYFLAPLIMAFGPNWAPLILVSGAIYEGIVLVKRRTSVPQRILIPAIIFAAFVFWAALSAFWSLTPAESVEKAAAILGLGACGFLLLVGAANCTETHKRTIALSMAFGTALLALQIAFEVVSGGAIARLLHPPDTEFGLSVLIRLKPGTSVLAIFVWPALSRLVASW